MWQVPAKFDMTCPEIERRAQVLYIINNGHIVETLTAEAVHNEPTLLQSHLGV